MGGMSKRWHSWLIEHVRSIETFATEFENLIKKSYQEREVLFSGKLGKESCSNANDVTEVFNKDHGGDNVGAMLQGEIERCPNVGMNLECKTKLRRRFFYHVALS
ncbi:hypothetical protein DEO72_LG5g2485 [Vigna unguiculata]|uniref:Uncharacterized protein n=1 Tax=Vigna unguiculata TaxID=3917 RepID=A0A4D6LZU8_VIGUN|nr:hypothetical protein DEO72_LG5g2485 [Vigna unguiculata]